VLAAVVLLVAAVGLSQEVETATDTGAPGAIEALIALLSSGVVSLLVGVARAVPWLKAAVADAGTLGNRMLPLVCLVLGVIIATVQAHITGVKLHSSDGWALILQGVQWGLAANGVQSVYRTTLKGQ
jgi:hypothetical protein